MVNALALAGVAALIFAVYASARNRMLKKEIEIISYRLQEKECFSESLVEDLKNAMDKISIERAKNRTIEMRLKAESKGFIPRGFYAKWDTKSHAMSGHFIAECAERVEEIINREDATIKEISEFDITRESCIEQTGWRHGFLR